jgi:hypothetical protein
MNRRTVVRNVLLFSAGAAFLPSCFQNDKTTAIPLKNISLNGSQQQMLAALADAIIPSSKQFIGAKDLKAHEFVLTMVDDCLSPDEQQKFTQGIVAFDKLSHDQFGQLFVSYTAEQKKQLLSTLEAKKDIPGDALSFYETVKRYTVQCFTSSKEYMLDIRNYKMVPGSKFKGCVPVNAA